MQRIILFCLVVFTVCVARTFVVGETPKRVSRAKPPTFSERDRDIFFDDIFTEALIGERSFAKTSGPGPTAGSTPTASDPGAAAGGIYPWSEIISATALEDEVKKIKLRVDEDVTTPTKFASNGYQQCRKHFSMLAMLFAIAGEYDKDVRWREEAPELRDAFARAASNCKTGSTQAYNEAKERKEDLATIIRGGSLTFPVESEREVEEWMDIVDRAPLMQRLEISQQGMLQPKTASADEFKSNMEEVVHEANLVAAIGEILAKDTMIDGIEEEYSVHAEGMTQAALDVIKAADLDNYDMARKAVGEIGQTCSNCHADWR